MLLNISGSFLSTQQLDGDDEDYYFSSSIAGQMNMV
jgi:hypothetical protein